MFSNLYVEIENFIYKIENTFKDQGRDKNKTDVAYKDINKLSQIILFDKIINNKSFYFARLHEYFGLLKKIKESILKQRIIKTNLEEQDFTFILAENVRAKSSTRS